MESGKCGTEHVSHEQNTRVDWLLWWIILPGLVGVMTTRLTSNHPGGENLKIGILEIPISIYYIYLRMIRCTHSVHIWDFGLCCIFLLRSVS